MKNVFYHCPGSHYDITKDDKIFDIGHSFIKGYDLENYSTRFIEIKNINDNGVDIDTVGYIFVEYENFPAVPRLIGETLHAYDKKIKIKKLNIENRVLYDKIYIYIYI